VPSATLTVSPLAACVRAYPTVRHGFPLLRQSFAVSLPPVDTKRSAACAPVAPTTSTLRTPAARRFRTLTSSTCISVSVDCSLPAPSSSRHELVRAHVAARAGRAGVAVEVGRGGSGAGARVDGGGAGTNVDIAIARA